MERAGWHQKTVQSVRIIQSATWIKALARMRGLTHLTTLRPSGVPLACHNTAPLGIAGAETPEGRTLPYGAVVFV